MRVQERMVANDRVLGTPPLAGKKGVIFGVANQNCIAYGRAHGDLPAPQPLKITRRKRYRATPKKTLPIAVVATISGQTIEASAPR